MIDEPLALLAEAFGQDPEPAILPFAGSETSEDDTLLTVIAAATQPKSAGLAAW